MQELDNIKLIQIDKINILNPRTRSRKQHLEIVESIKTTGLKRPITVRIRTTQTDNFEYDLICGQGRLEAFKMLKQKEIWACVLDVSEEQCLVMSLVENIARHNRSSTEQMQEIQSLRERGHTSKEIAGRIGTTETWVNMVSSLLDRGESRLLAAVDSGTIPLSLAIQISRSSSIETQDLLTEALEKKEIKGTKIAFIRNLLDKRDKGSKSQSQNNIFGRNPIKPQKMGVDDLRRIYEEEMAEQELLAKRAELWQETLNFIQRVFKKLLANPEFRLLLQQQGFLMLPATLQNLIDHGLTYDDE